MANPWSDSTKILGNSSSKIRSEASLEPANTGQFTDFTEQDRKFNSYLVAHPTARKWVVITPVINGLTLLIHTYPMYNWDYNPLTSSGMSHQVVTSVLTKSNYFDGSSTVHQQFINKTTGLPSGHLGVTGEQKPALSGSGSSFKKALNGKSAFHHHPNPQKITKMIPKKKTQPTPDVSWFYHHSCINDPQWIITLSSSYIHPEAFIWANYNISLTWILRP